MSVRTARPIGQSLHPAVFIAREDFVACFAGDIELPAQHRHLLPVQQSSHKTQPLVHLVTLLPRHLGSPQMPESVTHVPGMKCHLCARKGILNFLSWYAFWVPASNGFGFQF